MADSPCVNCGATEPETQHCWANGPAHDFNPPSRNPEIRAVELFNQATAAGLKEAKAKRPSARYDAAIHGADTSALVPPRMGVSPRSHAGGMTTLEVVEDPPGSPAPTTITDALDELIAKLQRERTP